MRLLERSLALFVLVCVGCSAQSAAPELNARIEQHVRAYFKLPVTVDVKVGPRKSSDFAGYDSVTITLSDGPQTKDHEFLISRDGNTLVRMTKIDLREDLRAAALKENAETRKKITLQGRPVRGNKDAKVEVVVFDDFQCPYCARMHNTLFNDVMKTYGDRVRVLYKDYPLPNHPWAVRAALDANCLAEQNHDGYWDFSDRVHLNQREITGEKRPLPEQLTALDKLAEEVAAKRGLDASKLKACIKTASDRAIVASIQEGDALGINSTPTLYVNGEVVVGAVPAREFRRILDRALMEAGEQVPTAAAQSTPVPKPGGTAPAPPNN
ncbi:MAG: DsbA family protein [Acidobacteria bacterium]|nr:DsbA family protein [Acidobacteriota bacterium]